MEKGYYKTIYGIFWLMLILCGAARFVLKLAFTDPATGFFLPGGSGLALAYNILLAAGLISLPVLNIFHRGNHDYRIARQSVLLPVLALLSGLSIGFYTWNGLPDPLGQINPNTGAGIVNAILYVNMGFGVLASLAFLAAGVTGILRGKAPSLLMAAPAVWQIVLLLSRFNGYYSIAHIADYMLAILFMLFAALFFMGHARTLCGYSRKDGRNYVISSGLCTAACGFLLAIPNFLCLFAGKPMVPMPLYSLPEACYVLIMSIYALIFVLSYTRSMKRV